MSSLISPKLADQYGIGEGFIPYPGFRAGAGYEWNKWRFGFEAGYTRIKGNNPLVQDIRLTPLVLTAGYVFNPIQNYDRFSLVPNIAFGMVFAQVEHYKDAIDILTNKISSSSNTGFLLRPGVRAGWEPFPNWEKRLEVFAGFSVDCIIETSGVIPLPQMELGVIIRPFRKTTRPEPAIQIMEEPTEIEIEIEEIDEQIDEEIEIEIEIEPPEIIHTVMLVLFDADRMVPNAAGIGTLNEAGNAAADLQDLKITIKGYAAPFVSASGQREVSRRRASYCAAYLMENFGITEEQITIEWHGSDALPENIRTQDNAQRRSVEIILEGWKDLTTDLTEEEEGEEYVEEN